MSQRHGKLLRGLTHTLKSPLFQGRFGRMFRSLPVAKYGRTDDESRKNLVKLGELMISDFDPPKDGFDPEESGIPALYTYFGQFIDHDITFDPMSSLMQQSDPDALTDFRTPALDLDNVYGRGPDDQPYLYDNGPKFLLGDKISGASDPNAQDLPRNNASLRRALIGDARNDENSIVSQLQGLFLRFHNRAVDDHPQMDFHEVQRWVRFHYQWVVLNDFLPRIVNADVLQELKTGADGQFDRGRLKFFHWRHEPFMPVEFSVAAYRLGHSMVRPGYRMNDATLLPIFSIPPKVIPQLPDGLSPGLEGFKPMDATRAIDWGRFIDIDTRSYGTANPADPTTQTRLQFAYRLDTSLVTPLSVLPPSVAPDPPMSLAQRNLIRSFELRLPSGQDVACAMHGDVLRDDEIIIGKAVDSPQPGDVRGTIASIPELAPFKGKCPLWTYVLAEAARTRTQIPIPVIEGLTISTPQLGPVGGRIVAEVFLGMMFGDNNSYLNLQPTWVPAKGADYRLKDLVRYALGQ